MLALTAVIASFYWPSVTVLCEAWTDFQNIGSTHGFLVAATALALILRVRGKIAGAAAGPSLLAGVLLFAVSFLWLVSYRAAIRDLHVAIFPVLLGLAIASALGREVARYTIVPLGLIVSALPGWGEFMSPLRWLTVVQDTETLACKPSPSDLRACTGRNFARCGSATRAEATH